LLNIEDQIGERIMDEKTFNFIDENYSVIDKLISMRDEYYNEVIRQGIKILNGEGNEAPNCKQNLWPDGKALQFYAKEWRTNSYIVILMTHEGFKRIQFYISNVNEFEVGQLDEFFKNNNYTDARAVSNNFRLYGFNDIKELNNAFDEFRKIVKN